MNFEYINKKQAKYISKKLKVSPNALFSFQNIDDYIWDHNIDRVETALHDYIKKLVRTDKEFAKKIGVDEDDEIEIIKDTYLYDDSYWIYTLTKKKNNKHEYIDDIIMVNFYDWKDKLIEENLLNVGELEEHNSLQDDNNYQEPIEQEYVQDSHEQEYVQEPEYQEPMKQEYVQDSHEQKYEEQIQESFHDEDLNNNIAPIPIIEKMEYKDNDLRLEKKYSSMDNQNKYEVQENKIIENQEINNNIYDSSTEPLAQENTENIIVNNKQEPKQEIFEQTPIQVYRNENNNRQTQNVQPINNNRTIEHKDNSKELDNDLTGIYEDTNILDEQNNNYMSLLNPFLDKVHYTKTKRLNDLETYEVYVNSDKKFKKYNDVDFNDEINNFKTPKNTSDIEIEDIEQIGNNGYIPYPYGPLKRPPVPYDLWRLIKDKKNLK